MFGSDLDTAAKVLRVLASVGKVILLLAFLYMFICSLDTLSSAFQLIGGKYISLEPPFVSRGCFCIDRETTCYCEPRASRSFCFLLKKEDAVHRVRSSSGETETFVTIC